MRTLHILPLQKLFRQVVQFSLLVARRFIADGSSQTAASLTYTSLLALVPLLTLVLAVVSAFPAFAQITLNFKEFLLQNMMPDTASKVMDVYMLQFSQNTGKLTLIGTGALIVTALLLMQTVEQAFNRIWHVKHERPWLQRFLVYWIILTLGPLLMGASLYVTSYLTSIAMGIDPDMGIDPNMLTLHLFVLKLVPTILSATALFVVYLIVPYRYVPVKHALLGGLIGAVLFESMKILFSNYISHFSSYTVVYGAFSVLPIFLLWMYLSWMTVLLGASITASLPYFHHPHLNNGHVPGSAFYTALSILERLAQAHRTGHVLTLKQLSAKINPDQVENVLAALNDKNWALRTGKGWALAMHPDHILLREVFEALVFQSRPNVYPLHQLTEQAEYTLSAWIGQ